MNIFVLDLDPATAARQHCDKHVVKMATETTQMLCTALWLAGYRGPLPYKPTHPRHPCVLWAAESRANFRWLGELGQGLVAEHGRRYSGTRAGQRGHPHEHGEVGLRQVSDHLRLALGFAACGGGR